MKKTFSIVTLLLIIFTGAMLSGCTQDSGSLSLSLKNADKIELLTTDQKVDYTIVVENSNNQTFDAQFDFYFAEQKATYVNDSLENLGGGEYKFSIAPLAAGNSTLTISLKGQGKSITVPVSVIQPVESVSAKTNVYVKKGDALTINSSMFTFTPENTNVGGLSFKLKEDAPTGVTFNQQTNVLTVTNDCKETQVIIVATSTYNQEITTELVVNVADPISLTSFDVELAHQQEPTAESGTTLVDKFGTFNSLKGTSPSNEQSTFDPIELVITNKTGFKKKIKVEYDFAKIYAIEIFASTNITLDGVNVSVNPITIEKESEFVLSASDITEKDSKITFKIYQKDFAENYAETTISVSAICEPSSITVNNQKNVNQLDLYTTGTLTSKALKFGIMPQKAVVEDYYYKLEWGTLSGEEFTPINYSEVKEYFTIKLNDSEPSDDDKYLSLDKLQKTLTISATESTSDYCLRISCYKNENFENLLCKQFISINVYTGAKVFRLNDIYTNGTIYVPMGDDPIQFYGLLCKDEKNENAAPGEMSIFSSSKQNICTIEQVSLTSSTLKITPKSVGEQTFKLTTANGLFTEFKVVVLRTINQSDIKFDFADQVNNYVSDFDYDDDNLSSITLKGKDSTVNIAAKTKTDYTDYNELSFTYSLSFDNDYYFEILNNKTIKSKNFTKDDKDVTLTITLTLGNVTYDYRYSKDVNNSVSISLKCVNYIKSISLSVSNSSKEETDITKLKKTSIYNKKDLSYINSNLATMHFYLDVTTSSDGGKEYITSTYITNDNIKFYVGGTSYNVKNDGSVSSNNSNIGTFVFDIDSGTGHIGYFEFSNQELGLSNLIKAELELTDSQTGEVFKSDVSLTVEKYIDVSSIWLSSPEEYIYLDSVNSEKTISIIVYPENANCKDIYVYVDTNNTNCLKTEVNGGNITFGFKSAGSGKILIFPYSVMKTNSLIKSNGEYYYHLELDFVCADGESEETALRISSLQDLQTMSQDKHYYLDSEIDCKETLLNLNLTSGSIRGTFLCETADGFDQAKQYGSIKNFVVNNGLFQTIGEAAKVYNLSFVGKFNNYSVSQDTNIGLLCGTNNGTISNVYVELADKNNVIIENKNKNKVNVNFGLVAGENNGTIQVDNKHKNYTLLAYNTQNKELSVEFGDNITSNFGGIVGSNQGTISNEISSEQLTIGLYGINACIFAKSNATNFGGIVGSNQGGTISGLKVTGEIDGRIDTATTTAATNVAGFVAVAKEEGTILNNISRIFVRGAGNILGGFVAISSNSDYSNNKIQAVDDGTKTGLNASFIVYYGEYVASKFSYDSINFKIKSNNTSNEPVATAEGDTEPTIITAETYFTRQIPTDINTYPYDFSKDNSDSKAYYYGDVIFASSTEITFSQKFSAGSCDDLPSNINCILAAYMQASNSSEQDKISNLIESSSLLKFFEVTCTDLNLEILTPSVARIESFGKSICILGIGELNIKISSALNYTKSTTANLNITNYFESITNYQNKEKTEEFENSEIKLINYKTTPVYFKASSDFYNYKNTPIPLAQNNEISFKLKEEVTELNLKVQGTTVFVSVKEGKKINDGKFTLYPIFELDENKTYFQQQTSSITGDNNKTIIVFKTQTGGLVENEYKFKATMGIDNLSTNKSDFTAEPTDTIEFVLSFDTYNTSDYFTAKLIIADSTEEKEYNLLKDITSGTKSGSGDFIVNGKLTLNWEYVNDNQIKFKLQMLSADNFDSEIYKLLVNKTLTLTFTSSITQQSISVNIKITPETISSVLITNYDSTINTEMMEYSNGTNILHLDKMPYSGLQASSGELNVINANVNTIYSEFEYVDVNMQLQSEGGYLGYVRYDENKNGSISSDSVYTSISGGTTIRIYKNDIDTYNNSLLISLIYRIPKTIADGTIVPITFSFYNNKSELIWVESTDLVSKLTNQVSFEIYNKKPVQENVEFKTYNVAEGMTYLLDTTIVGYSPEEAVFEYDNGGVASVVYAGDSFYLKISNNLTYSGDYFEVTITSYGKNETSESIKKTTKLHIFKFLVADDMFGGNNTINLRLLESTNIQNIITNKIEFECAKVNTTNQSTFIGSFKDYAKIYLLDKNGKEIELKENISLVYDEFIINGYTITTKVVQSPCDFAFVVKYKLGYIEGAPSVAEADSSDILTSYNFEVNSYLSTTSDNATPIYNYSDLLNMKDDEYYRQVADITISPSQLQMITVSPKMFDGNGYKIVITSGEINFELDSSSEFALFKNNKTGNIIKNITIEIAGNLNIVLDNNTNVNGANIALLVAENNGIITNCAVKSEAVVTVDILSTIVVMENSYFAGLCANNYGYITNCQIECNLTASGASLAGVVANNTGTIASSYIKNSRIYNTTSTTNESITTAGFVSNNTGKITMCYVEGFISSASTRIYADYVSGNYTLSSKIIYTSTKAAGFVFENSGNISDCYSNIPLVSTNESSGFVAKAISGTITRVFSLSKLKQQDVLNFGFVAYHEQTEENVIFNDCFFVIEDNIINYNTSQTNYKYDETDKKYKSVIDGIEPLSIEEFNVCNNNGEYKTDTKFKSFITNNNNKAHGVWFYVFDRTKETSYTKMTYTSTIENDQGLSGEFVARRLQLVSPNTIAFSQQDVGFSDNNNSIYYTTSKNSQTLGSEKNPYIITSVKEFETYCNQLNGEYSYYRQVCDINYLDEQIYSSNLFNKTLIGYYEGNGFSISDYSVNTITSNLSAGLFANFGLQKSLTSCLKNTNFEPYYINLPNSTYVGGVAGTLTNADVCNVSIAADNVVIVGKNIVGGLFGRASGENNIDLVYSNIIVKASYYDSMSLTVSKDSVEDLLNSIQYSDIYTNGTKTSYSGSLVGYLGGTSKVTLASVGENVKTLAMISGLMFGGIGGMSTVSDFSLNLNSFENSVEAYAFAGYVAGEVKGTVKNFTINSNIINYNAFTCYPITPIAVGGIAGYAKGANIENVSSSDGYSVVAAHVLSVQEDGYLKIHNPYIAKYVGGIIGYSSKTTINNVSIGTNDNTSTDQPVGLALMGSNYVGGIFGYSVGEEAANNTITGDINISLIGEKTYINADEVSETNKLYISYVSESVGEDIPTYSFNPKQYIGFIAGNSTYNNCLNKTSNSVKIYVLTDLNGIFENYGTSTNAIESNNPDDSKFHICDFCDFVDITSAKIILINKNLKANTSSNVTIEDGTSGGGESSFKIKYDSVNIISTTTYTYTYNETTKTYTKTES